MLEELMGKGSINEKISELLKNEFYVTDKLPVFTLRECLEESETRILDMTYLGYQIAQDQEITESPSKEELIKVLEPLILEEFENRMVNFSKEERNALDEIENKEYLEKSTMQLLECGFQFGFKKKGKNVYVIPKELVKRYQEYKISDQKKKVDEHRVMLYTLAYLLIYQIVKKDFIFQTYQEEYGISLSKEEMNQLISKQVQSYDEYYVAFNHINNTDDEMLQKVIEVQREPIALGELEIEKYINVIHDTTEELTNALKKENKNIAEMIFQLSTSTVTSKEEIVEAFKLTKNEKKKVLEVLERHQDNFRYWYCDGKTKEEYERDIIIEKLPFAKKPTKTDLLSCLHALSASNCDNLCKTYEVETMEELVEQIKIFAMNEFDELECFEKNVILMCQNENLTKAIRTKYLDAGCIFLYKDNEEIKCLIPDEIVAILEENDMEESMEDTIVGYLDLNGIMERQKLQELLEEYHDYSVTLKELDALVQQTDIKIINKKYYSLIDNISKEDIEKLIECKNKFQKYKKIDFQNIDQEHEYLDKLYNILEQELTTSKVAEMFDTIRFLAKNAMLNEDIIDFLLEENAVSLSIKTKKEILELYKQYKKYIGVWVYNGYTILEASQMQTKTSKVGRNEPCPCGSGKKYKKCCGK